MNAFVSSRDVPADQKAEARVRLALGLPAAASRSGREALASSRRPAVRADEVPVIVLRRGGSDRAPAAQGASAREAELTRLLHDHRERCAALEQALRQAGEQLRALRTRLAHAELAQAEAQHVKRQAEARLPVPAQDGLTIAGAPDQRRTRSTQQPAHRTNMGPGITAQPASSTTALTSAAGPDTRSPDRAAVLRLVLAGLLSRPEACVRLGLSPRRLRELITEAERLGPDGLRPMRASRASSGPAAWVRRKADRVRLLPLVVSGQLPAHEACTRLGIKPRCLRKLLAQHRVANISAASATGG